jgi:glycosyltransferase involved in cell wall biosynthesis
VRRGDADGLVSVVIPAFNCMSTIGAAVQSCLDQTGQEFEVIVVNDGSTDGTRDVLARFGNAIRVIDQANAGLAGARSVGQRAARGEFLAWMDGDDLARPERLAAQVAALQAVPEAALVCSNFSAFHDTEEDFDASYIDTYYASLHRAGGVTAVFPNEARIQVDGARAPLEVRWGRVGDAMIRGNFVHPPTVLMRRSLAERTGDFDRSLRFSSDYDFLLRASQFAVFAYVDSPLIRYRCHGQQMSLAARLGLLQLETVRIMEKIRGGYAANGFRGDRDLRRSAAQAMLSAAYALARSDRIEGLRLVRAAQSHYFLPAESLRALARLAVPNAAVDAAKRMRDKFWFGTIAPVLWPEGELEFPLTVALCGLTQFAT